MAVLLTGCWSQVGFDAGHSNASSFPTPIGTANVGTLKSVFSTTGAQPGDNANTVESGGTLFTRGSRLSAYSAAGADGCSGSPTVCAPLWQSPASDPNALSVDGSPAVADGKVWAVFHSGSIGLELRAFDAAGVTNCRGTPKVCSPIIDVGINGAFGGSLTIGPEGPYISTALPSRSGSTLFMTAYDKAGTPRWTSSGAQVASPAVTAGGLVYAGLRNGQVGAFDAAGVDNCSASNGLVFCQPVWTTSDAPLGVDIPVVRDGRLFVRGDSTSVAVFDASGTTGCSGIPKTCTARWKTSTTDTQGMAVAPDTLVTTGPSGVHAFSLEVSRCSGAPLVCSPRWNGVFPGGASASLDPTIAGRVVYAPVIGAKAVLAAYDLDGTVGCNLSSCSSLWTPILATHVWSPIVVGDTLFGTAAPLVGTNPAPQVTAFRLP